MIQLTDEQFAFLVNQLDLTTMAIGKACNKTNKQILRNDRISRSRTLRTCLNDQYELLDGLSAQSVLLSQEVRSWAMSRQDN